MATQTGRGPGRPRSEPTRQAILAAALQLAAQTGADSLTMEAIAKRAAVSKETLYRWWSNKVEVLLEAEVDRGDRIIRIPDTGSLGGDLRAFMRATARALDPPTRRILRTLAAGAAADERFADEVRERFLARRRAALATILERAVERDELTADHASIALDLIYGSLWYRLIFAIAPLDNDWADSVTAAIARN